MHWFHLGEKHNTKVIKGSDWGNGNEFGRESKQTQSHWPTSLSCQNAKWWHWRGNHWRDYSNDGGRHLPEDIGEGELTSEHESADQWLPSHGTLQRAQSITENPMEMGLQGIGLYGWHVSEHNTGQLNRIVYCLLHWFPANTAKHTVAARFSSSAICRCRFPVSRTSTKRTKKKAGNWKPQSSANCGNGGFGQILI